MGCQVTPFGFVCSRGRGAAREKPAEPAAVPRFHALTLWQPWAYVVAGGWKPVENRDWPPPAWLLGRYFAVHAGARYSEADALWMRDERERLGLPHAPPAEHGIARGAIVAVARLAGAVELEPAEPISIEVARSGAPPPARRVRQTFGQLSADQVERVRASPWTSGPWAWLLEDVVAVPAVACRGAQKLWAVPDEVADLVRDAWRRRHG
jgi:hypothetical protein